MRSPLPILLLALFLTASLHAADAWQPEPRKKEYPWMSVARWNEMHANNVKRAQSGPVNLLFLGDSITEGWGGSGKGVWEKNYTALQAANFGIGGDMTQQVLWRITEGKEIDGLAPKACVLMIGTNNFGLGGEKQPENVAKGVRAILDVLAQKLPNTKVLLLAIFPRDAKPETNMRKNVSATNALIAKFDDGKNVRFLDIGAKLANPDGTLAKEIMPDFLHLSPKGYEIWAEAIKPSLEEMMK